MLLKCGRVSSVTVNGYGLMREWEEVRVVWYNKNRVRAECDIAQIFWLFLSLSRSLCLGVCGVEPKMTYYVCVGLDDARSAQGGGPCGPFVNNSFFFFSAWPNFVVFMSFSAWRGPSMVSRLPCLSMRVCVRICLCVIRVCMGVLCVGVTLRVCFVYMRWLIIETRCGLLRQFRMARFHLCCCY